MRRERPQCYRFQCEEDETRTCAQAAAILHQKKHGRLDVDKMQEYLERQIKQVLPVCERCEQLIGAINEVTSEPEFPELGREQLEELIDGVLQKRAGEMYYPF